jgi:hypothetical protein
MEKTRLSPEQIKEMHEYVEWYDQHFGMDVEDTDEEPYPLQVELEARYQDYKKQLKERNEEYVELQQALEQYHTLLTPPLGAVMSDKTHDKIFNPMGRILEQEGIQYGAGGEPTPNWYPKFKKAFDHTCKKLAAYKKKGWVH